jgi:uncharacterized glyoxalase superfamily protein PhnB
MAQPQDLFVIVRYENARAAMAWLEEAFGFVTRDVFEGEGDTVGFAEMAFGNDVIGTGTKRPGLQHAIAVYVEDIDAHYERAKAGGVEIVQELEDTEFGARIYVCRDVGGHTWSFGTYRPDKPAGCDIFPVLGYTDQRATIDWLVDKLGAEKRALYEGPDHSIAHAELAFGHGVVMPSQSREKPDNAWAKADFGMYVCLRDVDAHYQRAKAAGAEIVRGIEDTNYGSREYSVRDLEGGLWSFGTYRPAGSRP